MERDFAIVQPGGSSGAAVVLVLSAAATAGVLTVAVEILAALLDGFADDFAEQNADCAHPIEISQQRVSSRPEVCVCCTAFVASAACSYSAATLGCSAAVLPTRWVRGRWIALSVELGVWSRNDVRAQAQDRRPTVDHRQR